MRTAGMADGHVLSPCRHCYYGLQPVERLAGAKRKTRLIRCFCPTHPPAGPPSSLYRGGASLGGRCPGVPGARSGRSAGRMPEGRAFAVRGHVRGQGARTGPMTIRPRRCPALPPSGPCVRKGRATIRTRGCPSGHPLSRVCLGSIRGVRGRQCGSAAVPPSG